MSERHIHIYLGTNDQDMRKQIARFMQAFSDPTSASMNISRLDAPTVSERELLNTAGSMPFLASQRLILLENIGKRFKSGDSETEKKGSRHAGEKKKFLEFLASVPPFTRLVITDADEPSEKEAPRHWLIKWAAENAQIAEWQVFRQPSKAEMPRWIINETKQQGGGIDPNAARELAEMVGTDTRQAANEITKLLTYVNFAHNIALEDVAEVSIVSASVNIFDLVDAIGKKETRTAQLLLHRMLDDKDAFEIFGMIIRQFRLLLMARDLLDDSMSAQEAAAFMGVHPFAAEKALTQARAFSLATLKDIYHRLLAIDEASKTGGMPLEASLDILIMELLLSR